MKGRKKVKEQDFFF